MASKAFVIAIAVVSMVVAPTIAIEHLVGDDQGWKLKFDYKAWAESKEFHVGDKLIFKYKEGAHNVFKADLISFQDCAPTNPTTSFNTGNDVIELASAGKKWYLCGIRDHCDQGMKVAINVLPEVGSPSIAPSNSPGSLAASGITPSKFVAWIVATFSMFLMIIA